MPRFETGKVLRFREGRKGLVRGVADVGGVERNFTAYTRMTGPLSEGDRIVVNTTAVDLDLGTGGEDFVVWNLESEAWSDNSGGHIIKLRYSPGQIDVFSAEAPESPHHDQIASLESIAGAPVVVCSLHSQLAPAASLFKVLQPRARLAYLMSDGASLSLNHSDLIAELVEKGLVDLTLTAGHAFGGDLEVVNLYSGLAAASAVGEADAVLVGPGPGVVGTDTSFGHTGMDQADALLAAQALGGTPVAVLRISFADQRSRHQALSHHSVSALLAAPRDCVVAAPDLNRNSDVLRKRLDESGISERHKVKWIDARQTNEALAQFRIEATSMGRGIKDDPAFFEAAGAAGALAASIVESAS